jgi:hypothetical protein
VLLTFWLIAGPGQQATRCIWVVVLVPATWLLVTRFILNSSYRELVDVLSQVTLLAAMFTMPIAGALRVFGRWQLVRELDGRNDRRPTWQFGIATLLRLTVIVALVLMMRQHLAILLQNFGGVIRGGADAWAHVRIAGTQCAIVSLIGIGAILGKRLRLVAVYFIAVFATVAALVLYISRYAETPSERWQWSLRTFSCIGGGALLVVLGTLLPLRAWGWRIVRPTRPPAAD